MHDSAWWTLAVSLLVGIGLIVALRNQRRRAKRIRAKYREMAGEEERMFIFLHDLGLAIGKESTDGELSKLIVDGVLRVVGARGGAIYYQASDQGFLNPAYVSEECPPLVAVPKKVAEKSEVDPRVLESHLRRARVTVGTGIVGKGMALEDPVYVPDVKNHDAMRNRSSIYTDDVSAMISPLRYAGRDLGVLAVARRHEDGDFTPNDFAVFRSVAEQSAFAIGNARVHRDANEKKAIEGELRNAREVQRVLLPQEDPKVCGFRVNGTNLPARIISGDYYDYIVLNDGKLGVVIADVSGKGVSAGLLMAMCRSLLRAVSMTNASPSAVLAAVNGYLFPDIREDMFISMIYGVLDPETGTLTYARAGHEPAMVFRKSTGTVEISKPRGLAVGIDGGAVFERVTKDEVLQLEPGDCVLLFTDGVKEALNAHDEEFGMERLADVFRNAAKIGAEAIVERLQEAVSDFTGDGPQLDDVTIVAIEKR